MDFGFLCRGPHFPAPAMPRSPRAWLTIAMILYGILVAATVSPYVGGSDSSGYFNNAQLLSVGKVSTELRTIPGLPPESNGVPTYAYMPLGFCPHGPGGMAPTYPMGLPLLMVVASVFTGWLYAPGWVAGWNLFVGVLATYGVARECGLRPAWSLLAAAILALSPLYMMMGLQPMSDVVALTWCTLAIYFALKTPRHLAWDLLCGFSLAIAVLVRPTNILIFLPVLVCLGLSWRRWAWVICGGLPGAMLLGAYNYAAYGKVLTTGYGNMSAAFSSEWFLPTVAHYAYWLPQLFTPLILLAVGLFWSRADKKIIWILSIWMFSFFAFYSFYMFTKETWWYLRFILPAAPALIVAALLVLSRLADHFQLQLFAADASRRHLAVTAVLLFIALLPNIQGLRRHHAFANKAGDRTYWRVADWLNHNAPANSVVATMQNSGSLISYSSFTILRWDCITEDHFSTINAVMQANDQSLYTVLLPYEEADVFAKMRGNWKPVVHIFPMTIWQYHPLPKVDNVDRGETARALWVRPL